MFSTAYSLTPDEIRMRWAEPYVTVGLNLKTGGVTPAGIYRGFKLGTNVAANTVTVSPEAGESASVAVHESSDGYNLTVRRLGALTLDLSSHVAVSAVTLVIALHVQYVPNTDTIGAIRAYPLADYEASPDKPFLVVLGTVVLPGGGGVIPAGNITADRRTLPWQKAAPGLSRWVPLLRNGTFVCVDPSNAYRPYGVDGWHISSTNTAAGYAVGTNAVGRTGQGALAIRCAATGTAHTVVIRQGVQVSCVGRAVRYQLGMRTNLGALSGTGTLNFLFYTTAGTVVTVSRALDITTVTGAFGALVAGVLASDPTYVALLEVNLTYAGVDWSSVGNHQFFDDVQVWVESAAEDVSVGAEDAVVVASPLIVRDPRARGTVAGHEGLAFDYDRTFGAMTVAHTDGTTGPVRLDWPGTVAPDSPSYLQARFATTRVTLVTSSRTLVSYHGGGPMPIRRYHTAANVLGIDYDYFEETINAEWDQGSGSWLADDSALPAVRRLWGVDGTIEQRKDAPAGTSWLENAWDRTVRWDLSSATTRTHAFDGTLAPGGGLQTTAAEARLPRVAYVVPASGVSSKTLVSEAGRASTLGKGRVFHATDPIAGGECTVYTFNAAWNGTNWVVDSALQFATQLVQGAAGFRLQTRTNVAAWVDADWGSSANGELDLRIGESSFPRRISARNSVLRLHTPTSSASADAGNPTAGTLPYANTLYPKNIVKAWGQIRTNGAGGVNLQDAFGIASAGITGSSLDVTLSNAMTGTSYAVVATSSTSQSFVNVIKISASVFRCTVYSYTGVLIDPSSTVFDLNVMVCGEQA